jgi:hypothetical protein
VAVDRQGALLVADDVGNVIWRVQGAAAVPVAAPAVPVAALVVLVVPVPADVRAGNVGHRAALGVGVVAATRTSCNHNS